MPTNMADQVWRTGSIFSRCKGLWDVFLPKPITTKHQSVFWLVSQSRRRSAICVGSCLWISLAAACADPVAGTYRPTASHRQDSQSRTVWLRRRRPFHGGHHTGPAPAIWEFDRPLNVAFLDIKAAFDSVDRRALWKALRSRGIPDFLLDLIAALHENTGVWVRLGQNFRPSPDDKRRKTGLCSRTSPLQHRHRLDLTVFQWNQK